MKDEERLDEFVREAEEDPNIVGFFLVGSRSKGRGTKHSDYDLEMIVKDGIAEEYREKYSKRGGEKFNFAVKSVSEFENYATLDNDPWDKPRYMHVEALVDKNGRIQDLIDQKSKIPEGEISEYVRGNLDGYINYFYRSIKCIRNGNYLGARLEASKSIHIFLKIIFGQEGRPAPFYKYLDDELENNPLENLPLEKDELFDCLLKVLEDANLQDQMKLYRTAREMFKDDYPEMVEDWDEKIQRVLRQIEEGE